MGQDGPPTETIILLLRRGTALMICQLWHASYEAQAEGADCRSMATKVRRPRIRDSFVQQVPKQPECPIRQTDQRQALPEKEEGQLTSQASKYTERVACDGAIHRSNCGDLDDHPSRHDGTASPTTRKSTGVYEVQPTSASLSSSGCDVPSEPKTCQRGKCFARQIS